MNDQERGIIMQAWAESILALTAVEMSMAVMYENGVVPHAQLQEIVQRLRAFIDSVPEDVSGGPSPKAFMLDRLRKTAERWEVSFKTN